jgi:hypothetical protein
MRKFLQKAAKAAKGMAVVAIGLLALSAMAGRWVESNPFSTPVPNQVTRVEYQGDGWMGRSNVLRYTGSPSDNWNGVLPALATNLATLQWCKVSNSQVVPMTQAESNSVITAQTNAAFAAKQAREVAAKAAATNALVEFFGDFYLRRDEALKTIVMNLNNNIRTNLPSAMSAITEAAVNAALRTALTNQPDNAP